MYDTQCTYYILQSTVILHHLFPNNGPNFFSIVAAELILNNDAHWKIGHSLAHCTLHSTTPNTLKVVEVYTVHRTVHFFIIYCTGCPGSVQWVLVRPIALPRLNSDSEKWKNSLDHFAEYNTKLIFKTNFEKYKKKIIKILYLRI